MLWFYRMFYTDYKISISQDINVGKIKIIDAFCLPLENPFFQNSQNFHKSWLFLICFHWIWIFVLIRYVLVISYNKFHDESINFHKRYVPFVLSSVCEGAFVLMDNFSPLYLTFHWSQTQLAQSHDNFLTSYILVHLYMSNYHTRVLQL